MSKELKFFLAALLIIAAGMFTYIICCGNELTLSLEMPVQAEGCSVTSEDEDVVSVISTEYRDGMMHLLLRAGSRGSTTAHVSWEPDNDELSIYNLDLPLSVTVFGGVKDGLSGVFTGWKSLPVGLMLFFFAASLSLFHSFDRRRKTQLFSYITVMCAGLGLFTLVLGVFALRFAIEGLFAANMTLWLMYLRLVTACQNFVIWSAPVVVIFAAALFVSNIVLIRHEGFALNNVLGIFVSLFALAGVGFGILLFYSRRTFSMRNAVCSTYSSILCYLECMMFAVMLSALAAAKHLPDFDKDFIVILGCRIRPDGTLYPMIRSRVDRAMEFARLQEDATGKKAFFLPSGGKGSDECMAEAEGMAKYLRANGIDDERIFIEKQSTTTWENMILSKKLVEHIRPNAKVAFSTNNYHVFRSGMLARQAAWEIDGMGSKTKWYFWPNAFTREILGLLATRFWVHLGIMAALAAGFTAMTFIF